MISHSRSWLLYLIMIFILTYVGVFFIGDNFSSFGDMLFNKIFPLILILGNTFIIYWISLNYSKFEKTAFLVASLYCVSPFHIYIFFFPHQIQFLISETCLLVFIALYLKYSFVKSSFFFILAFVLNFKLLTLVPFFCLSKKMSFKLKIFICLSCFSVLIFSYPLFFVERVEIFNNYKTILYLVEKMLFPASLSFFNYAAIVHDYYSLWFLNLIAACFLVFGVYYFKKNYPSPKFVFILILSCGLAIFFPVKNIFNQATKSYYFNPEYYPFILLLFLFLTLVVLTKYTNRKVELVFAIFGIVWILSNINLQQRSNNILESWNNAIRLLPEKYDYMEDIKFDYVKVLIAQDLKEEAEKIIIQAKKEYLKVKWFALHLELAAQRKDKKAMQDIYNELVRYKIPYSSSAFPEAAL